MSYFRVTLTYRVDAVDPEEAEELARDLAFEDVDPLEVAVTREELIKA